MHVVRGKRRGETVKSTSYVQEQQRAWRIGEPGLDGVVDAGRREERTASAGSCLREHFCGERLDGRGRVPVLIQLFFLTHVLG
jgi:hypothetical protein